MMLQNGIGRGFEREVVVSRLSLPTSTVGSGLSNPILLGFSRKTNVYHINLTGEEHDK
jgi:hypothetical protein